MDSWWDAIDGEILGLLQSDGEMDSAELAERLEMSEAAVCSCLTLLALDGKVHICRATSLHRATGIAVTA
jgi:DNA-binding Lrp family transcriptional regulator